MTNHTLPFIQWFRSASPYIHDHRGKTFVLMLPGQCLQSEQFHLLVNDIALLSSLGIRLVLVYGARPQIDTQLAEAGVQSSFAAGIRITEAEQIPLVSAAVGALRVSIEAALSAGLPNSPMQGAHIKTLSGNFVTAMPRGIIDGVDYQHTGKVRRIDSQAIVRALDQGAVVTIGNLGYSLTGEVFNLSYSEIATELAVALGADKLLALMDEPAVSDNTGTLQRELSLGDCQAFIDCGLSGQSSILRDSLAACYHACRRGVTRAHLIDYRQDGALLSELFSRDGAGTMVYSDSYETLRQATIEDVGGILELLEPLEREGVLVRRSRELLETEIDQFKVIEKDGAVIACAALYPFAEQIAEVACVATQPAYRNQGRGALLLKHLEKSAVRLGIKQLFILTTQTAHWFLEQGFAAGQLSQLPADRQQLYNYQRKSKVFIKQLSP